MATVPIPSVPQLNIRGLDWLRSEAVLWTARVKTLSGQNRADAQAYLDAVNAELKQREQQYSGGLWSTIVAGFTAPFEALGGSSGPGASGLGTSVASTASDIGSSVTAGANRLLIVAAVVIVLLGGVYIFVTKGKA